MRVTGIKQGTQEWLQWRHNGIAATDAASIMDANPYASPLDVYFDKVSDTVKHIEQNAAMEWGSRIESLLVNKFAEMHPGIKNLETSKLYAYDKDTYFKASLDAEADIDGEHVIIECKTGSSTEKWFNPDGTETVPLNYFYQVQWQMLVTGYRHVFFSVLINGRDWFERSVTASDKAQANLIEACNAMHERINSKSQPEPSKLHAASDLKLLTANHSVDDDDTPDVGEDIYSRYTKAKYLADTYNLLVEQLKLEIAEALSGHKCLMFGNKKFAMIVSRKSGVKLSDALVKAQFPEVYSKCLIATAPSKYLKVM